MKIMKSRSFTLSSSQNALGSRAAQIIYFRLSFDPPKVLFFIFLPQYFIFFNPSLQCKQKFEVKFCPQCQAHFRCWISLERLIWFFLLICESSGILSWDIFLQKTTKKERGHWKYIYIQKIKTQKDINCFISLTMYGH